MQGFVCSKCGEYHEGIALDIRMGVPDYVLGLSEEERDTAWSTDDLYAVNEYYFVRGLIALPIIDSDRSFTYNAWVSVSQKSFNRCLEIWNAPGCENEPPYFGWLSNTLPGYPDTLNLKTNLYTQPPGLIFRVELEPTDHPLAVAQREGMTMADAQKIAELLEHG
jgi:hypothetical protein